MKTKRRKNLNKIKHVVNLSMTAVSTYSNLITAFDVFS